MSPRFLTTALTLAALAAAGMMTAGCAAESSTVRTNPVWSAAVPDYGVEYSKTTNVFPFYSKNVTVYTDRVEETGNALLFISWSKTTVLSESESPEDIEAAEAMPAPVEEEAPGGVSEE